MIIVDYNKKHHEQIIAAAVKALKAGKVVAYPTDTSYGLAVDANNIRAIKKLYLIKGRNFNKPAHVVAPSVAYAKKIARWNKNSSRLAKKFWPGALTLVLPVAARRGVPLHRLTANTGFIGIRFPDNQIAQGLAKHLKCPITATSANLSGGNDCYSADEIIRQFSARGGKNHRYQPDIIINAGKLPRQKPSTVVKVFGDAVKILRAGPITKKQINSLLNTKAY